MYDFIGAEEVFVVVKQRDGLKRVYRGVVKEIRQEYDVSYRIGSDPVPMGGIRTEMNLYVFPETVSDKVTILTENNNSKETVEIGNNKRVFSFE